MKPVKKVAAKTKEKAKSAGNIAAATLTDVLKERLLELRRRGYNRLFRPQSEGGGGGGVNCGVFNAGVAAGA